MRVTTDRYDGPTNTKTSRIDFVATFDANISVPMKPKQLIYIKPKLSIPLSINDVLSNFDIDICQIGIQYTPQANKSNQHTYETQFIVTPQVANAIRNRQATITSVMLETRTISRAQKYASRGFKFDDETTKLLEEDLYRIPYE